MKISGTVQKGHQRGKGLGFPTANVAITEDIPEGIYVAEVRVDKKSYEALTFVGAAKTFNETHVVSETYVLDFDDNLYDKELEITLLEKIRDNQKFRSIDALVEQMRIDEHVARRYFAKRHSK